MADTTAMLLNKAQAYLRSAAVLCELEDFDSCASRCYFAMLYAAQALFFREDSTLPAQDRIGPAFVETFVAPGRLPQRAGSALRYAHLLYEKGDFSPMFAVARSEAERVLQEAEAFVNTLAHLVRVA